MQCGWIDSVAPCAQTAEGYGGAKADALLAVLAAGVEAVEPVARDVAALDGNVSDVCVFHCTEFLCLSMLVKSTQRYNVAQVKSSVFTKKFLRGW